MYSISIIIPVKNGASTLEKCLNSIKQQKYNGTLEILVLDSESSDRSFEIAQQYGAKIIKIPAEQFNHGLTRNIGIKQATGDLVYFTVQDAWLAEVNNLQIMSDHFNDISVQSVTGMQAIPHDLNKNPALWFKRISKPVIEVYQYSKENFNSLAPIKQKQICCWDNVNSMYRKTALIELPFDKTNLSEDMIWSKKALEKGWTIIRDPAIVVYHYHHHEFCYNFKLNYSVAFEDKRIFGLRPSLPSIFIPLVKRIYTIVINKSLSIQQKIFWIFHNAGMFFSHTLSVFIFRMILLFRNEKLLERSLFLFSRRVPQGKQK